MTTNIDLDQAREWAEWVIQAGSQIEVDPDLRGAANVIQSLPDEWIDADNLADAGRLMPDLPEPQTFPNGEREWYTLDGWVNLGTDGTITVVYDERDEDDLVAGAEIEPGELVFTRISEAKILARAFLAATNYAEKEMSE